eukprot:scaffold8900_cov119-Isochrysis_galbana.AAC.9
MAVAALRTAEPSPRSWTRPPLGWSLAGDLPPVATARARPRPPSCAARAASARPAPEGAMGAGCATPETARPAPADGPQRAPCGGGGTPPPSGHSQAPPDARWTLLPHAGPIDGASRARRGDAAGPAGAACDVSRPCAEERSGIRGDSRPGDMSGTLVGFPLWSKSPDHSGTAAASGVARHGEATLPALGVLANLGPGRRTLTRRPPCVFRADGSRAVSQAQVASLGDQMGETAARPAITRAGGWTGGTLRGLRSASLPLSRPASASQPDSCFVRDKAERAVVEGLRACCGGCGWCIVPGRPAGGRRMGESGRGSRGLTTGDPMASRVEAPRRFVAPSLSSASRCSRTALRSSARPRLSSR